MSENQPRYQIPTHLATPDTLDLPLFGITVSVTMRQGGCFLLGGSIVYQLWQQSFGLVGIVGLLAHWIGPFLLAFATYVIAVHEIWGRPLEAWVVIWGHYVTHPKVFVWCSVLESTTTSTLEENEEVQTSMTNTSNDEEEQ
jgi:membrane-bound ClpP family serine protease